MDSHTAVEVNLKDGRRIQVSASRIARDGLSVFFMSPSEYAELERIEDGGALACTHLTTIKPPSDTYLWTPPSSGTWWVLVGNEGRGSAAVRIVDADRQPAAPPRLGGG